MGTELKATSQNQGQQAKTNLIVLTAALHMMWSQKLKALILIQLVSLDLGLLVSKEVRLMVEC